MLNELIRLAQLGGSIDTQCQLAGNWHLDHRQAAPGTALVHIITAGTAYLDDQPLPAGTVLFSRAPTSSTARPRPPAGPRSARCTATASPAFTIRPARAGAPGAKFSAPIST